MLPSQLDRLQQAHRLLLAAQAAALCECAPLVYEAATRFYNRLVPLLPILPDQCPVIQPLLAGCHAVVLTVKGTAGLTSGAGKVAAGLTSQLFRRLVAVAEGGAARAVGKMDLGIFTPAGRSSFGGSEHAARSGSAASAMDGEEGVREKERRETERQIRQLEEELLSNPEWSSFESDTLVARSKDSGDAAAQILGVYIHSADGCEKAWAALKGDLAEHPARLRARRESG